MIEINLLPGKKRKAAGGAGMKLSMPDFRAIISGATSRQQRIADSRFIRKAGSPNGPRTAEASQPRMT